MEGRGRGDGSMGKGEGKGESEAKWVSRHNGSCVLMLSQHSLDQPAFLCIPRSTAEEMRTCFSFTISAIAITTKCPKVLKVLFIMGRGVGTGTDP